MDCSYCDICAEVNALLADKTRTSHEILLSGAGSKRRKHVTMMLNAFCYGALMCTTHSSSVRVMKMGVNVKRTQVETRHKERAAILASQDYFKQLLAKVPVRFKTSAASNSGEFPKRETFSKEDCIEQERSSCEFRRMGVPQREIACRKVG